MAGVLRITHPDISNFPITALTEAATVADTSLLVENGLKFSVDNYLILNGYGSSKSEIVKVHAATVPTATTITLAAANDTDFAHAIGDTVQFIPYNQVVVETSTDLATLWATGSYATIADASAAASWSVATTLNLTVSEEFTLYNDTSTTSYSYRTRFYNSTSAVYSSYSDAQLATGFEEFAVGKIISKALSRTNQTIQDEDTGLITTAFLVDEVNNCMREVYARRKRWSWNQSFDQSSEITAGQQDYSLPSTIDYRPTNKSLLHIRLEQQRDLQYIDKEEFDRLMEDVVNTTTTQSLSSATTTLTLTDTSDLPASGSFTIITTTTKDTITWTANNRTTNTLTLASTNGASTTHASGTNIWYQASFSDTPNYYTVFGGKAYIWPVPDTGLSQRTIQYDFYKKLVEVDSENDYILFPNPALVMHYLCMAICLKMNDDTRAAMFEAKYIAALKELEKNEVTGQKQVFELNIPRFDRSNSYNNSLNDILFN